MTIAPVINKAKLFFSILVSTTQKHPSVLLDLTTALELSNLGVRQFNALVEKGVIEAYEYKGETLYLRSSCVIL